jgi:hypothetical protein
MVYECNPAVNNIRADNGSLLTATLVTSSPHVPPNSSPFPISNGVRLHYSLHISPLLKFSLAPLNFLLSAWPKYCELSAKNETSLFSIHFLCFLIMWVPGSNRDQQAISKAKIIYTHEPMEFFFKQTQVGGTQERLYVLQNCKTHIVTC